MSDPTSNPTDPSDATRGYRVGDRVSGTLRNGTVEAFGPAGTLLIRWDGGGRSWVAAPHVGAGRPDWD